MSPVNPQ